MPTPDQARRHAAEQHVPIETARSRLRAQEAREFEDTFSEPSTFGAITYRDRHGVERDLETDQPV